MRDFFICLAITLYTLFISWLWYNKGTEDTMNDMNDITSQPSAIDVYRGRTTLEITYKITYKDTVAVDSVVVFK